MLEDFMSLIAAFLLILLAAVIGFLLGAGTPTAVSRSRGNNKKATNIDNNRTDLK